MLNQTFGVSVHHSHTELLKKDEENYLFLGSTRDDMGFRDFWLAEIGEPKSGLEDLIFVFVTIIVVLLLITVLFYGRKK